MIDAKNILFIVQARLSSQRVPQKMIRPFADTTLVDIALQKVVDSDIPMDNFYLSVYEPELVQIGKKYGVNIFRRSEKSARSEGWPLTDIYEWHDLSPTYTHVVLISACNPLLRVKTINDFINTFQIDDDNDGLFGVIEKKTYYWNCQGNCVTPFTEGERIMNTKIVQPLYEAAHCLYGSRIDLIPQGHFMGNFTKNHPGLFVMDELEAFDIDYEWQFTLGEKLYQMRDELYESWTISSGT